MTYVVIAVPLELERMARVFLPPANSVRAKDRIYFIYHSAGDEGSTRFDDLDGQLLVAMQSFPTQDRAIDWIKTDAAQRAVLLATPAEQVQ